MTTYCHISVVRFGNICCHCVAVPSKYDFAARLRILPPTHSTAFRSCILEMNHAKEFRLPQRSSNENASVVSRKWLDILSALFALFPPRPTRLNLFQFLPCAFHFGHYLFDRRRPDERSGGFIPGL